MGVMVQIPDSQPAPMSLTAYAKRRGVSAMAVSRAVKRGRLKESVTHDARGQPKIRDPDLADREWAANTDYSEAPASVIAKAEAFARGEAAPPPPPAGDDPAPSAHEGMTLSEATATEKIWRAKQAELKFRREAAELVPSAEVRGKLEAVFSVCRTKLLGVPSRARQTLPHLTVADIAALEDLVREALEDLAAGKIA